MLVFKKITSFIDKFFSKYWCSLRKDSSAQDCFLICLESGKAFGALLTDFSKTIDCHLHKLIISKLNTYGYISLAFKLINNYLVSQKQRTKINKHLAFSL